MEQVLIDSGADLSKLCEGSPLSHVVFISGAVASDLAFIKAALQTLQAAGSNLLSTDDQGRSIFHLCAVYDTAEIVSQVIELVGEEQAAVLLPKVNKAGMTALHVAARAGNSACVGALIKAGANVLEVSCMLVFKHIILGTYSLDTPAGLVREFVCLFGTENSKRTRVHRLALCRRKWPRRCCQSDFGKLERQGK